MAESNATQVILTDDGIKIIKAQNTADSAAGGVTNLNDPNLMNVIEKQNNIGQFAGLTSQYNVIIQNAKDDGIDTTAVTTAYNNLNQFMAEILADPNHASDVDRITYKKYQDAYNEELSNLKIALQNNTNNKFTSAANATSQAASVVSQAFIQAQSAVDYVNSETAVQSAAIDEAQSAASDAVSKAESTASEFGKVDQKADSAVASALNAQSAASDAVEQASSAASDSKDAKQIAGAVSQSYKTLTDGSTMTIAELQNGLAAKLTKADLDGYATQTWTQNQVKMTADGINGTMSSIKGTVDSHTTSINDLKADSSSFKSQFTTVNNTLGKQTTDIGTLQASSKELTSGFNTLTSDNTTNKNDISQLKQTSTELTSTMTTVQTQVQNSAVGTNLAPGTSSDWQKLSVQSSDWGVRSLCNPTYEIVDGETYTLQVEVRNVTAAVMLETYCFNSSGSRNGLLSQTRPSIANDGKLSLTFTAHLPEGYAYFAPNLAFTVPTTGAGSYEYRRFKIEKGSLATDWCPNPAETATQSQITQLSGDINLRVTKDDLIDQINVQAGNTLISSSGQLTLSGKNIYFDSTNPVIIPSANIDTALVNKKLTAADISANTFTTNNGTFTVFKDGSVVASNLTIRGVTNLVYNAALLGGSGSYIPGWGLNGEPYYDNGILFDGLPAITWNGDATGRWDNYANSKFQPLTQTGIPYSASIKFRDYGSASGMLYLFTLGFFSAYDANTRVGYLQQTYTANGSDSGIQTLTINNAISPSNAKYVAIQLWAYNGKGHMAFSSPMLTQTAQATGYQPDTGNVVSAGIIDGSTINGGTINMQTDGLINSPYNGIQQSADQFYHPWKLNTGQLTIGQGYITSVSSGTRSINGVPKQFDSVQGTLSASYLKFTNNYGARTYIDADMFTYSNQTNDTAMVAISAGGVGINMGTMAAPALTISNGYLDASSSSSYGMFGAITLGYNAHTINSDDSLFFESGHGSGNPGINIWAKGFQSLSSRLSTKRQVRLLDDEHSNSLLLGADTATFQYNQDTNADNSNEGVIIDDVNTVKQYNLPDELITRDGKAPTDLMSFIARVISQNKYQARLIEDLQIRLRKVEIKNE